MATLNAKRIDGTWVRLGGQDWLIPPLLMVDVMVRKKASLERVSLGAEDSPEAWLEALTDLFFTALKRNYADLTTDELADVLDYSAMGAPLHALREVSGLTTADPPLAPAT